MKLEATFDLIILRLCAYGECAASYSGSVVNGPPEGEPWIDSTR